MCSWFTVPMSPKLHHGCIYTVCRSPGTIVHPTWFALCRLVWNDWRDALYTQYGVGLKTNALRGQNWFNDITKTITTSFAYSIWKQLWRFVQSEIWKKNVIMFSRPAPQIWLWSSTFSSRIPFAHEGLCSQAGSYTKYPCLVNFSK